MARRSLAALAAFTLLVPVAAGAQAPTYPSFKVSGRLQLHFYGFDNADYAAQVGPSSSFFTRRARIQVEARLSETVSFVIQPSYEGGRSLNLRTTCDPDCTTTGRGGVRLRDAYVDVRLSPAVSRTAITLRAGQEKRPFGRYELMSSNNLPSIERGAGAGLVSLAANNLFETHGFLGHDVGASLIVTAPMTARSDLTFQAGVYNGQGESLSDVNGAKSYGARLTVGVTERLSIGGAFFRHDGIVGSGAAADSAFYNDAWGVDAQWGRPGQPGLFLLAEHLRGEDRTAARRPIAGTSLVGAVHIRLQPGGWLYALEPALRADVADPDVDLDGDEARLVSGVLGLYLNQRTQVRVAYERQSFEEEALEPITGIRTALTVNF